ncbi:hypothetical protein PI126_g9003 [Phytophthora idaei]|nr:hypothetical protein PI126_g9003 [Phytophthora idaei]
MVMTTRPELQEIFAEWIAMANISNKATMDAKAKVSKARGEIEISKAPNMTINTDATNVNEPSKGHSNVMFPNLEFSPPTSPKIASTPEGMGAEPVLPSRVVPIDSSALGWVAGGACWARHNEQCSPADSAAAATAQWILCPRPLRCNKPGCYQRSRMHN